ncbi:MAG TPA: TlyA family rRNA (cytidine-2'-O)-methyltransferase, partial [Firmicutes bacterium]|nr:TlyA family rRNA (cytidine-2'-O)-methyltransferase [Bacillota bacterium]
MRLDRVLVERGLAPSRQRAKELICQGQVIVDGEQSIKPSASVPSEATIQVLGLPFAYPSRAGLKLERALKVFDIDVKDKVA